MRFRPPSPAPLLGLVAALALAPFAGLAARAADAPPVAAEPRGVRDGRDPSGPAAPVADLAPALLRSPPEGRPPGERPLELPRIEFHLVTEEGEELLALGANAFTAVQLARFVAGVPGFLAASTELGPGERLVLRQEGVRGYISLSTVLDPGDGPRFLITLRAEPPGEIGEEDALRALIALVGEQAIARFPRQAP